MPTPVHLSYLTRTTLGVLDKFHVNLVDAGWSTNPSFNYGTSATARTSTTDEDAAIES